MKGVAVLGHHALGAPGRTRGVDHIAKVVRQNAALGARDPCWRLGPNRGRGGIERDNASGECPRNAIGQSLLAQE